MKITVKIVEKLYFSGGNELNMPRFTAFE